MLREISTDVAHGFTQGGQRPWAAQEACQRAVYALSNWDESSDHAWIVKIKRLEDVARDGAKDPSMAKEMCRQLNTMCAQLIREIQALPPDDEQRRLGQAFNDSLNRHSNRAYDKALNARIVKAAKSLGVRKI